MRAAHHCSSFFVTPSYIGACFTLAWTLRDLSWMFYNSVGFSGVLFALAALESTLSPAPTRSVFGLITVPTKLYPWALLLVLQVSMGLEPAQHLRVHCVSLVTLSACLP